MKVVNLPPIYSREDARQRQLLIEALVDLERSYRRDAQPLIDALARIEARYPPSVMVVPDDKKEPKP